MDFRNRDFTTFSGRKYGGRGWTGVRACGPGIRHYSRVTSRIRVPGSFLTYETSVVSTQFEKLTDRKTFKFPNYEDSLLLLWCARKTRLQVLYVRLLLPVGVAMCVRERDGGSGRGRERCQNVQSHANLSTAILLPVTIRYQSHIRLLIQGYFYYIEKRRGDGGGGIFVDEKCKFTSSPLFSEKIVDEDKYSVILCAAKDQGSRRDCPRSRNTTLSCIENFHRLPLVEGLAQSENFRREGFVSCIYLRSCVTHRSRGEVTFPKPFVTDSNKYSSGSLNRSTKGGERREGGVQGMGRNVVVVNVAEKTLSVTMKTHSVIRKRLVPVKVSVEKDLRRRCPCHPVPDLRTQFIFQWT